MQVNKNNSSYAQVNSQETHLLNDIIYPRMSETADWRENGLTLIYITDCHREWQSIDKDPEVFEFFSFDSPIFRFWL